LCSFGSQTVGAQPGLGRNEKRMENAGFLHEFKGFLRFLWNFYVFFEFYSISIWFLWIFFK
jgi:hypothetical protein